MKGHIWKLTGEMESLYAWELHENIYVLLSDCKASKGQSIDIVEGKNKQWFLTHIHYTGNVGAKIVDHTEGETVDSYLLSREGQHVAVISVGELNSLSPEAIVTLYNSWLQA